MNIEELNKILNEILKEDYEADLRESIIKKFTNFIIDELSELHKLEYAKTCDIKELTEFINWESVFFHQAISQADRNANFFSWRSKAAHNKSNIMTNEEDTYFWSLNDDRHLTLAKQVARQVQENI